MGLKVDQWRAHADTPQCWQVQGHDSSTAWATIHLLGVGAAMCVWCHTLSHALVLICVMSLPLPLPLTGAPTRLC